MRGGWEGVPRLAHPLRLHVVLVHGRPVPCGIPRTSDHERRACDVFVLQTQNTAAFTQTASSAGPGCCGLM